MSVPQICTVESSPFHLKALRNFLPFWISRGPFFPFFPFRPREQTENKNNHRSTWKDVKHRSIVRANARLVDVDSILPYHLLKTPTKMPTRFSKNRKSRGHVSAGHGRIGEYHGVAACKKKKEPERVDGHSAADTGKCRGRIGTSRDCTLHGVTSLDFQQKRKRCEQGRELVAV